MCSNPDCVMLFAAGFGTRMKHLTKDRPKPMIEVAGRPLIDHALGLAREIQPRKIVANLHYLPEILDRHLVPQGVQTLIETPDILDTGGGLKNAMPIFNAPSVFTMNTDAIWLGVNPLLALRDAWDPNRMDALLTCVPVENTVGHAGAGDFSIGTDGVLSRGDGWVYGGVQIIKTALLETISETSFSLNVVWDKMQRDGRLFGINYSGKWCDVGHPQGVTQAETLLGYRDV